MAQEIIAYFRSTESLYPYGIPKRILEAARVDDSEEGPSGSPCVLVVGPKLSTDGLQLLEAALTKGLKLTKDDYEIHCLDEPRTEALISVVEKAGAKCVVYYGLDASMMVENLLQEESLYGAHVIETINPDVVFKDPSKKRSYWEQLKKVLTILEAGRGND